MTFNAFVRFNFVLKLVLANAVGFQMTENSILLCALASLWPPYVIGQARYTFILSFVMAALCNRAGHIYFHPVVCYGRPA